jgi:hypothetical protein
MFKDKKYKNNVLIIKSKNSNNSINNLEWVSYADNVVLPITTITFDFIKDKIKLKKRVDGRTVELNHYEVSEYWKILESKHDEFLTTVNNRMAVFLHSAAVYYPKYIDLSCITSNSITKHCTIDYSLDCIIVIFGKNNNFEDIKIIFTFDNDCIPEGYSYDIIYLSNKRPVFKEQEECLGYLKKMYIDNLRLRNKMALDDEIDKINKIQIREFLL